MPAGRAWQDSKNVMTGGFTCSPSRVMFRCRAPRKTVPTAWPPVVPVLILSSAGRTGSHSRWCFGDMTRERLVQRAGSSLDSSKGKDAEQEHADTRLAH